MNLRIDPPVDYDTRPDFRETRHVVIGLGDALLCYAAGGFAALIVVAVLVYLQIGGGL
jgi:hypothetical protein